MKNRNSDPTSYLSLTTYKMLLKGRKADVRRVTA